MSTCYLASPYGFALATQGYLRHLMTRIEEAGVRIEDPWADIMASGGLPQQERKITAQQVALPNFARIDRSDFVIAILDGTDVDSGVACEIGYAFAKGKPVLGLRTDWRDLGDLPGHAVNLQVGGCLASLSRDEEGLIAELRRAYPAHTV